MKARPGVASLRLPKRLLGALLAILALFPPMATAEERILDYDSDIVLGADGSMTVTETIRAQVEGDRIRRGIYRDFPTDYRDPAGHRVRVRFEFLGARRDGVEEHWRSERHGNGVRVYLGREDVFLPHGEHSFVLHYRTDRQLHFGERHDELYWNATGNGWEFAIDSASALVRLPRAVPAAELQAHGYTGAQGSMEAELDAEVFDGGARFRTTRPLGPREGLSVVLAFPKGLVSPPGAAQELRWLLADNAHILFALAGIVLLWAWYASMWRRHGRDPQRGVVIPIYEPPKGYSAASLRFVREMGYDNTCFAAAVLSLASKGALSIDEDEDRVVTLQRGETVQPLAPGERALFDKLFGGGRSITLKRSQATAKRMQAAQAAHKAALAANYEKTYFLANRWVLVPGVLLSLLVLGVSLVAVPGEDKFVAMFLCVWLAFWSIGVFALVSAAVAALRGARGIGGVLGAAGLWAFATPFLIGEVAGLVALAMTAGVGFVIAFALLVGTNLAFQHWMKAPTQLGARLLDQIEGFRWYLGVAEKQELDARYRPESRPDLFSTYLPYALALDLEQAWAERFASALTPEQLEQARPGWYHGSHGFSGSSLTGFTSHLSGSLGSAIASASTAPGSGSSGGGGSGGGGGGGGGGGW